MTPQQQSIKTRSENLARHNLHRNCAVAIKQVGPHWGLYCKNTKCTAHGKWINWVAQQAMRGILQK